MRLTPFVPAQAGTQLPASQKKQNGPPLSRGANGDCCGIPDFAALHPGYEMGWLRQRPGMTEKKVSVPE